MGKPAMTLVATFSHHTSVRLAEVAFLCLVIAGVWMAVAWTWQSKWLRVRMSVAGALIAAAGVLLIVASHWGRFG